MLTVSELKALYKCCYFQTASGTLIVRESQQSSSALRQVELNYTGDAIFISPKFLEDENELYLKSGSRLNLRQICDGVILLSKEGKNYLIVLELKSGYNEVCRKAVNQVAACYLKMKFHLHRFVSYSPSDYEELGLIVSFPPEASDKLNAENNDMIWERKMQITGQGDPVQKRHDRELRTLGKTTLCGADYQPDTLNLHAAYRLDKLTVKYCGVDTPEASVNLDDLLLAL